MYHLVLRVLTRDVYKAVGSLLGSPATTGSLGEKPRLVVSNDLLNFRIAGARWTLAFLVAIKTFSDATKTRGQAYLMIRDEQIPEFLLLNMLQHTPVRYLLTLDHFIP